MAKYAIEMNRTASTSLSVGSVVASSTTALRRLKVYDWMFGSEAAAADNPFLWQMARITAAGTSTGVTPTALDPADSAMLGVAGESHTVDATYTAGAIMLSIPLNQRASYRWVAAPGSELVGPATNASGFGIKTPTSSAVAVTTTVLVEEQ